MRPSRRFRASFLLPALLSIAAAACGDTPLTPDEVGASQESTMAMFAQIIDKLETIEERIDSLEAVVGASGGGELVLTGLPAAQLDSVLALASFLAEDATSGSLEVCGEIGLAGEFGTTWIGEAEGEGAGHLGAWAGTGAYAGGKITAKADVHGAVNVEGNVAGNFCYPFFAGSPAVRPTPGPARAPALDELRSTLSTVAAQRGLDESMLAQSIQGVGTIIGNPGSLGLATLGDHLPLPPAIANLASDPLGTVTAGIPALRDAAQSALCSGIGWGGPVSTVISDACDVIDSGGLANFTVLSDITETFPAIQSVVSTTCARINAIGLQRLVISSWDVTFPLGIGTVNVFPGYNQRLFPNYTSFACS